MCLCKSNDYIVHVICFIFIRGCPDIVSGLSCRFCRLFLRCVSRFEQHNIFHMRRMGEHVHGLYSSYTVSAVKGSKVACLRSGVTAYIYYAARCSAEYCVCHILMHSGTWRVGYYYVGTAVYADELIIKKLKYRRVDATDTISL